MGGCWNCFSAIHTKLYQQTMIFFSDWFCVMIGGRMWEISYCNGPALIFIYCIMLVNDCPRSQCFTLAQVEDILHSMLSGLAICFQSTAPWFSNGPSNWWLNRKSRPKSAKAWMLSRSGTENGKKQSRSEFYIFYLSTLRLQSLPVPIASNCI